MASEPTPVEASQSKNTQDDDDPSWLIPVILGGAVGFLLLVIIIILYCRWKKGAPSKKIQPGEESPTEEYTTPKITNAADPEKSLNQRRPPSVASTSVNINESGGNLYEKPVLRKLPVRENSLRRKVTSNSPVRSNLGYIEESENGSVDDERESRTIAQVRHQNNTTTPSTRMVDEVPRRSRPVELPVRSPSRRQARMVPALPEPVVSEEESDEEMSDESEVISVQTTKDNVDAKQLPVATLPTMAVMTDIRPPAPPRPPVIFRSTIQLPPASLPPIDTKPTSLVNRVVDEEKTQQSETATTSDSEPCHCKHGKKLSESQSKRSQHSSPEEKKAWKRTQKQIGSVLDPEAMQSNVRKHKRKYRRKYPIGDVTGTDEDDNVKLKGYRKLSSPRNKKSSKVVEEPATYEDDSGSDISVEEAQKRIMTLLDDAFTTLKHKQDSPEKPVERSDVSTQNFTIPQAHHTSTSRPVVYARPASQTLPEPAPAHGRASAPTARHKRRMLQSSAPYPVQYYPGLSGRFTSPYHAPPPVVTRNPVVVWDPADKQRLLNRSAYGPYPGNPYTYTDPNAKLHFTPVRRTPDGMGGLVWSPYVTEYAMEDFYRNVAMSNTMNDLQETSFTTEVPQGPEVEPTVPYDTQTTTNIPRSTAESAEPLVRAIKDELYRLSNSRTPLDPL